MRAEMTERDEVIFQKLDAMAKDLSAIKQQQDTILGKDGENLNYRMRAVAGAAVDGHANSCQAKEKIGEMATQLESIVEKRAAERGWVTGAWRVVVLVCVLVSFAANLVFAYAAMKK